mgnify:CR=1 FL=1
MVCLFVISHIKRDTHFFVHRFTHQFIHDELTKLVAIVAVNSVCQTNHHFKIIHVDIPVRMKRKQTERAMSVLFVCDTFIIYIERIVRNTVADETKSMSAISSTVIQTSLSGMEIMPPSVILCVLRRDERDCGQVRGRYR